MDITRARSPTRGLGGDIQLPDRVSSPGLGRRHATKRQTVEPARLSIVKTYDAQRAKFAHDELLEEGRPVFLTGANPSGSRPPTDWLLMAEKNLAQDIETSKKELELMKSILEDIEESTRNEKNRSKKLRDKKMLVAACQEYTDFMTQARRDRLRQVKFWISSREMGRNVPTREPTDWLAVDMEWRHWLSEQAAARAATSPIEEITDTSWRILGPLPYIVSVYSWLEETRMK